MSKISEYDELADPGDGDLGVVVRGDTTYNFDFANLPGGSGTEIINESVVSGSLTFSQSRVWVEPAADQPNYLYTGHIGAVTGSISGSATGTTAYAVGSDHVFITTGNVDVSGDASNINTLKTQSIRLTCGALDVRDLSDDPAAFSVGGVVLQGGTILLPGPTSYGGATITAGGPTATAPGNVTLTPGVGNPSGAGNVILVNLPTSDPGVAGAVWRSGNDLKISTG